MAGRGRAGDGCSLARRSVGFNLAGTAAIVAPVVEHATGTNLRSFLDRDGRSQ